MKSSKNPHYMLLYALDALALLLNLRLSPVQLNSFFLFKGVNVTFWRNSFEDSGKFLLGPRFNLVEDLRNFVE